MARLSDLVARIGTVRELGEVFGALRALAASHAQQADAAMAGITAYAAGVGRAMGTALGLVPPAAAPAERALVIAFGAELGFCGAFDERVLQAVPDGALWTVGRRLTAHATERGHAVAASWPMATRPEAVLDVARRLAARLYEEAVPTPPRVTLLFTGPDGVEQLSLLPYDPAAFPGSGEDPPLVQVDPAELLARLVDEYVLAELARAAMASFAAENAARLRTLQGRSTASTTS
ncbi:MAG: F0F1 ATP synthase subunit gamma [Myxococcota bacterium]